MDHERCRREKFPITGKTCIRGRFIIVVRLEKMFWSYRILLSGETQDSEVETERREY